MPSPVTPCRYRKLSSKLFILITVQFRHKRKTVISLAIIVTQYYLKQNQRNVMRWSLWPFLFMVNVRHKNKMNKPWHSPLFPAASTNFHNRNKATKQQQQRRLLIITPSVPWQTPHHHTSAILTLKRDMFLHLCDKLPKPFQTSLGKQGKNSKNMIDFVEDTSIAKWMGLSV